LYCCCGNGVTSRRKPSICNAVFAERVVTN
jgi:hypothetical protein